MANRRFDLATAAKLLGTGRNRLINDLKARGILDHNRLPRTVDMDAGRFVMQLKEHTGNPLWNNGNGQLYHQTLVTEQGIRWLAGLMNVEIVNADLERAA